MHSVLLPERSVHSASLNASRVVRIALPPSYGAMDGRRYPVVYLHDGQNVFSSAGPHSCFGWGSWQADRAAAASSAAGRSREAILVAVDNTPQRYLEYRGPSSTGDPSADALHLGYRRFLVGELKPAIDREFRTLPDPANTAVVGSSMGGLCSLVLGWFHPGVFGAVGTLSGAFQVERSQFVSRVLGQHRGAVKPLRIYVDHGVRDYTGGDDNAGVNRRVVEHLRRIGWRDGVDLEHRVDERRLTDGELEAAGLPQSKWEEAHTSQHNEFHWRLRFHHVLEFLLPANS